MRERILSGKRLLTKGKRGAAVLALFALSYLLGTVVGVWVSPGESGVEKESYGRESHDQELYDREASSQVLSEGTTIGRKLESGAGLVIYSENWGLGFGQEGTKPTGNVSAEELAKYNAWYVAPTEEKVIYLTFDAGYEAPGDTTAKILDALKKHNVSATFFLVGNYLETRPDLVKRMVEEGHTVGNHTYHHPDMGSISDQAAFGEELTSLEDLYQQITGQEMVKFYRPPQGKYSESNLQMAKDMGYQTFFWSLAYVDWVENDQPTKEEAFGKLLGRIHPGAIVLLHSTSSTNAEILDELLTKWEEMGYTFGKLQDLAER